MKRLILFTVTISLLLLLNAYYYLYHELHEEYPGNEDAIEGLEGKVSIYGTVVNRSHNEFYVLVDHEFEIRLRARS